MTRYVIDVSAFNEIASRGIEVKPEDELLAPTLIRSQLLSTLHEAVRHGELSEDVARQRLDRMGRMKIRLLGDSVLRAVAWKIADKLGWTETYDAEYLALTQLQGDAFITLDAKLAKAAAGVVRVASVDDLR